MGISFLGIQAMEALFPLDNQLESERVDALSLFSEARAIFADSDVFEKSEATSI